VDFEFVTGNLALDYVATVAERGTTDLEHLAAPADLADWIAAARLMDPPPRVDPAGLARAKQLREALFVLVSAAIEGREAVAVDRAAAAQAGPLVTVNAAATHPPPVVRLDAGTLHREGDLDAVLSAIARAALELLGGPERAQLRWCADERCTRPFVDRSRGGRRRWCGMAGCGDRAKAATYRARRRQSAAPPS
jgi:predicted RNA-binding Zn ribbon-like protein